MLAVLVIATTGVGAYSAYGSYMAASMGIDDLLLAENILALSDNGGIQVTYCWLSSKEGWAVKRTVCNAGTNQALDGHPNGTIYRCSGKEINGSLLSHLGCCYIIVN